MTEKIQKTWLWEEQNVHCFHCSTDTTVRKKTIFFLSGQQIHYAKKLCSQPVRSWGDITMEYIKPCGLHCTCERAVES